MNNLRYDERKGEFVETNDQGNGHNSYERNCSKENGNSKYLLFLLLGVIVVFLIIWTYNQGAFDNTSSTNELSNSKEILSNMHGFIGDYPITMQLTITGSAIEGSYYYDRGSSTLLLSGTNNNGDITLHETTAQGRPTGFFQGKISNGRFEGKFTNSKGQSFFFNISVR